MEPFEIVKPAVDIGVATNRLDASQAFWGETMGLRYDHLLKIGGGIHQHRYDLHGAVLKLNSHRDELADTPTGFVAITTVVEDADDQELTTPDGTPVLVASSIEDGIRTVVRLEATDADRTAGVLQSALGAWRSAEQCRIGETVIDVVDVPDREPTTVREGTGIRYLTIQVRDLDAAHAHAIAHGAVEGLAPLRLGDTAYVSFVLLPDGDWIELSQRASLTGPLPDHPLPDPPAGDD